MDDTKTVPAPIFSSPEALEGVADDTIAADTETVSQPFWSPIGTETLQAYTWFGPWGPIGARFEIPSVAHWGSPSKDFLAGTDHAEAIYGLTGANLLLGGGGDDLLVAGPNGDALLGGTGNDVLIGGAGNDSLEGGAGNDWLYGGGGANTLTGWTGQDVFAFLLNGSDALLGTLTPAGSTVPGTDFPSKEASVSSPDVITDFTIGEDLLLVGGLLNESLPADFNPFEAYVQLTQMGSSTLVTVNQVDSLGAAFSTDIAVLNNVEAHLLDASSFTFA
ncbi:type I secretion C-terminal target domain-containing protein [Pseudanabaena sp. FACHB-2040]|uniref:type I secretion C-terminal target domain-containing protein n=1 Tax=Pseudanabaena sp. FACHB-2040 TaxID=2692859 RepID=UPI0024117064|nr:type I secretion C-terminal target domain-containing protein [Pseudanabaena sp. FACHB-2040]